MVDTVGDKVCESAAVFLSKKNIYILDCLQVKRRKFKVLNFRLDKDFEDITVRHLIHNSCSKWFTHRNIFKKRKKKKINTTGARPEGNVLS